MILEDPRVEAIPRLNRIARTWKLGNAPPYDPEFLDRVLTSSSNDDWDDAFDEPLVLAWGLVEDNAAAGHYLTLSYEAAILNGNARTRHSLKYMVRHINGSSEYMEQVPAMMYTLTNAVGDLILSKAPGPRLPRALIATERLHAEERG